MTNFLTRFFDHVVLEGHVNNFSCCITTTPRPMDLNLARWWLTIGNFKPLNHIILWIRGYLRSRDKLKIFYLYCHNTYGGPTWQDGYLNEKLPSIKSGPFYRVVQLVILISLIRFVVLERKRLSHHRLLVFIVIG